MSRRVPQRCPACTAQMAITELTCPECQTRVQGRFDMPGLHRLSTDQIQFVEVFLRCRGNIREVEKDLKISYPTVRSRLDQIIQSMGYDVSVEPGERNETAMDALNALETGDLSFEEVLQRIKEDQ